MTWLKYIPYIMLTPFYVVLGVFIYYFLLSLSPAADVKITGYFPKEVSSGDEITVIFNTTRYRDCNNKITRSLINVNNSTVTIIGDIERIAKKSPNIDFSTNVRIPGTIPSGSYMLQIEYTPECNIYDTYFSQPIKFPPMPLIVNNLPADLHRLIIPNPVIKVGEPLYVENSFFKRRFCAATVDTFILLLDNTLVAKFNRPTNTPMMGENTVKEFLQLPDVGPGKYKISRSLTYTCPERAYNMKYQIVDFEVKE